MGCKTNFTQNIYQAIEQVSPTGGRVCDLFSGTGSVAYYLSSHQRPVTTVDIQEYSRVLCSAALNPVDSTHTISDEAHFQRYIQLIAEEILWCAKPLIDYEKMCLSKLRLGEPELMVSILESVPLEVDLQDSNYKKNKSDSTFLSARHEVIDRLKSKGLIKSESTTILRYFGGLYFSFEQSVMLDALLCFANTKESLLKDKLIAAAIGTASTIVNTIGKQFAQPLRPRTKEGEIKNNLPKIVLRDREIETLKTFQIWLNRYSSLHKFTEKNVSLNLDYLDAIKNYGKDFSVVYADPPYTRDHYSRFYHVLETMCLRDNPEISTVKQNGVTAPSRAAYRKNRHQSAFCIKSSAPQAFIELFEACTSKNLPLVLSYSPHEFGDGTHPRVVSTQKIIDLSREFYSNVEVILLDGSLHNKFNQTSRELKKREHAEILLKCFN